MSPTQNMKIKTALISVSDKTGLIDFAKSLTAYHIKILSTGGSAKTLRDAGIAVTDVSEYTGFPEMMDGRVKTLHPKIHGGLLSLRNNDEHIQSQKQHDIENIDLVVVNLYPFEDTVAKNAVFDVAIENIDIGGPAMLRSAAKNHAFVTVVTDINDYQSVLMDMQNHDGATSFALRQKLAAKTYARTAAYDSAISNWFMNELGEESPDYISFAGTKKQTLRYGENPHQNAVFYTNNEKRYGVSTAVQLQGKELSYNNINDTDAAFELVSEFDANMPACVIVKHANPCGAACGDTLFDAYNLAFRCDSVSAFGGIVAFNQTLDEKTALEIVKIFTEVIIAPDVTPQAQAIIAEKKNLRLLITGGLADKNQSAKMVKTVAGGLLVQNRDIGHMTSSDLKIVTKRMPTEHEIRDLIFAFTVAKHVKSNAIIYAKDLSTVGIGAGQMSRLDSCITAARKASDTAQSLGLPESLAQGAVGIGRFFSIC
jgi:phosphoribosylaminoimidazolecarboxamide formyltransferase / IMP cyclohydrolase